MTYYKLLADLPADFVQSLEENQVLTVDRADDDSPPVSIVVQSTKPYAESQNPLARLGSLYREIRLATRGAAARRRMLISLVTYALLGLSKVSVFFIRGWRLRIIRNMTLNEPDGIGPQLLTFADVGGMIKEGIRLILVRFLYDLPKFLLLAAFGYGFIEFALEFVYYLFGGRPEIQSLGAFLDDSIWQAIRSSFVGLLLVAAYSFVVTPAYKILEIKYAIGAMEYRGFFRKEEFRTALAIYKRNKFSTLEKYIWDLLVSGVSLVVGILLTATLPLLIFIVHPAYKMLFKHWPKAFGYGQLGRQLVLNEPSLATAVPPQITDHAELV